MSNRTYKFFAVDIKERSWPVWITSSVCDSWVERCCDEVRWHVVISLPGWRRGRAVHVIIQTRLLRPRLVWNASYHIDCCKLYFFTCSDYLQLTTLKQYIAVNYEWWRLVFEWWKVICMNCGLYNKTVWRSSIRNRWWIR